MKCGLQILLLLFCFSFIPMEIVAMSNLSLAALSNQELAKIVYTVGKVVLQDDSLFLIAHDGTILAGDKVSNIRCLVLIDGSTTSLFNAEDSTIAIYPNPTQDILVVNGAAGSTIRVFDLNGRCLISTCEEQVDVQPLPHGTYLLQVKTKIVKFIKN